MAKIIIVDDQPVILITLERILMAHKHTVRKFSNAIDALECLNNENIDLMITDAVMPGPTGFDLVSSMRKMPQFTKFPVLMLTGRRGINDVEKGIIAGVNDYLLKPINTELLILKVNKLLTKSNLSKSNFILFDSTEISWNDQPMVTYISKLGAKMLSNSHMPVGSEFQLNENFYTLLGVTPFNLQVIECVEIGLKPGPYKIMASFPELQNCDQEAVAKWLAENTHKKSA